MSERFDLGAKTWDEKPRRIKLAKNICEAIRSRVDIKGKRVTDFGTGTGLILLGLSDEAKSLTGLDFSMGMLEVVREKAHSLGIEIAIHAFDIDHNEFEPEGADVITSNMVTHHLKHPELLFNKAYKGLAEGGTLCVSDLYEEDGGFHDNPGGDVHHQGFSEAAVREMFVNAGFKNIVIYKAADVEKEKDGVSTAYPIFLATGVK